MYGHPRSTLLVASLATLATFLDTTILFVAFPSISATFGGTSESTMSWVLNGYTIAFAALLIPAGKVADRVGHRRMFLIGSSLFTVASMACGLAPVAPLLIAFRVLQAAGGALLIPASLALVMHAFSHEQLPRAVALWGISGAVAGALGPTLGAGIVESLGWRWAFFINLPVGIYTVVVGRRVLRESSDPDTSIPAPVGVVLVAAAAALLSYAVVGTDDVGWLGTRTVLLLAFGTVALIAFVVHQRSTAAPVLDLELFRIRNYAWINAAALVFGCIFSALFLGSILFLTRVWGWSVLRAGFGVAPGPVFVGLVTPRIGRLAGKVGQRPILLVGGVLFALCGVYRWLMAGLESNYFVDFFPSVALSGVAVGCIVPQLSSVAAQALPQNRRGVGGAALQAGRQFGGTFGVSLTVALLASRQDPAGALAAFDRIWWVIVVGGVVTSLLVLPTRTAQ